MFVRNNVFVVLKSPTQSISVQRAAEAVDKELMRLSSAESAMGINTDAGMSDAKR